MNTSTNAAAEMSPGILPCPGFPPATSDIGPKPRKPRGKIAELSKDQRALINHLLDEGLTYRAIELEMARQNISLNAENLSNWYNSGYQDYVRHQDWLEQVNGLRENASDLLVDQQILSLNQAALQLAVIQIFKTLKEDKLSDDPANYTRMLNSLSRLSREALVFTKYED